MTSIAGYVDAHLCAVANRYRLFSDWPEISTLICETAADNRYLRIPKEIAKSINAPEHITGAAVVAIACLQLSLAVIDDILDGELVGFHVSYGIGPAANAGCLLQTLGQDALLNCPVPCAQNIAALKLYQETSLTVALAQNTDSHPGVSETGYWEICNAKSGAFFGFMMAICATLAGWQAGSQILYKLGRLYGEIVQIQDDLQDALATPATPDWLGESGSLPLFFAASVPHAERERFVMLREQVGDVNRLKEAQSILFRSGAVSYSLHEIMRRQQQAGELIAQLEEAQRPTLERIFDELILPVRNVLAWVEERPTYGQQLAVRVAPN
jgi:geranylgeranyl pyrophosphate synthase